MSRAFVRESDDAVDGLPDRAVSPHPNRVTPQGLAQIEAEVSRLEAERADLAADDRAATAAIDRDLRYWRQRRATAQPVEKPKDGDKVYFGSTVTIRRDDGREHAFQIVGEDEADPTAGKVSFVSPLGSALIGKGVGDIVDVGPVVVEILAISKE